MNTIEVMPIGSGSTGNCFYIIKMGPHQFLIDLGIGYRKVRDALSKHGRDLEEIGAVFLTHGHNDHVKAALALCNHISCPVFANESVMFRIRDIKAKRIIIDVGERFEVLPDLFVTMFYVPHDFVYTCGYNFEYKGKKLSYLTDCGRMNDSLFYQIARSDVVIIESNHDIEMLKNGPYPQQLKKRILSRHGHLSNEECADTIGRLYDYGTRNFLLAHLSLHNNTPALAYQASYARLEGKDARLIVCPDAGEELYSFE